VAAPVGFADHIAHLPLQHRIAVTPEPDGAHGGVEFEDRRAEVLRHGPELEHVGPLGLQPLRLLRRLPGAAADARHPVAPAQLRDVALDPSKSVLLPGVITSQSSTAQPG
jgi:hypothetical protein